MTRLQLVHMAARLYPRAWRARYGEEFTAMIGQMPAVGWSTAWDTAKGALTMQLHDASATKLTSALGAMGLLLAGAASFAIPSRYCTASTLELAGPESALHESTVRALSPDHLREVIERHNLGVSVERLRRDIGVAALKSRGRGGVTAFQVSYRNTDPALAQRIARELTTDVIDERSRTGGNSGKVSLLDLPAFPQSPCYPNRWVIAALGAAAGAVLGFAWAFLRRARSPA